MQLKNIFTKQINRQIEGVIKADANDETSLEMELEEYVLTSEVEKRLEDFLNAYHDYGGVNGVWISGFFGSGKSHLLKILALLLENRKIKNSPVIEKFLPKCHHNEFLKGDLQKVISIPAQSILFNIDQKADVINKEVEFDALLSVFIKVFNEARGYYGKQPYIAQFEKQLDSRQLYHDFQREYAIIAQKSWLLGREQALLEKKNIALAFAKVTGTQVDDAKGILDQYRKDYKLSIEDFAQEVKEYLDLQGANFRLNFFVDEVGQYIAENVKLMTNLQTIAESLATKCQGRAWLLVTAQEDMDTVLGEMKTQQTHDFSKIQDRFAHRMKLTSRDVAEVIQKRLLKKNEEGIALLRDIYEAQKNNFSTLFNFSDGSYNYPNFSDLDHFIQSYPFIPYQFALFQSAIRGLSNHNAFEGKHSSVGERSMLAVFQQVAIAVEAQEVGKLATFDLMFEGIRSTLKSQIQTAIISAEDHLNDPFAVGLLKALFLVKYVKEFKASLHNLVVLMLDSFEQDLLALRKKVESALNLLEAQTYIQSQGELYEYLTDEEKDIEQEIKNTDLDLAKLLEELHQIIFEHLLKKKKINYGGQEYTFSRKIDQHLYGREVELSIHIITPFSDLAEQEDTLKMKNIESNELLIIIPSDERLIKELEMYKKTEKYIQQNISVTGQDLIKQILNRKSIQNNERQKQLQTRVKNLLIKSKFLINGTEFQGNSEDPQTLIMSAFSDLITRVYPNLEMLKGIIYTEKQIGDVFKSYQTELLSDLDEAEREVLSFIQTNQKRGLRTSLKGVIEKFERKPYGWPKGAILCLVAKLCGRHKMEVRQEGTLLEHDLLIEALNNSRHYHNILLEPQVEFTPSQVRNFKNFYEEFFEQPAQTTEIKAISQKMKEQLQHLSQQLQTMFTQVSRYPFLQVLEKAIETLKDYSKKSYDWYITDLDHYEDQLLDLKEELIEPIRSFMEGGQKEIYDLARELINSQSPNFNYLATNEAQEIINILEDLNCFKGNKIQQLKTFTESVESQLKFQIQAEINQALANLNDLEIKLKNMEEFAQLDDKIKAEIIETFNKYNQEITQQSLIAVIRDSLQQFETNIYPQLLSKVTNFVDSLKYSVDDRINNTGKAQDVKTEYISSQKIKVNFSKAFLANENDVDEYLSLMREALLTEIKQGRRIHL